MNALARLYKAMLSDGKGMIIKQQVAPNCFTISIDFGHYREHFMLDADPRLITNIVVPNV